MVVKLAVVLSLAMLNRATDDITTNIVLFSAWSMLLVYALISAVADGITGLVMQTGVAMSESFDAPMLARSPREFWGRRWNLFVTRWAFRNVFVPAGGVRAAARGTLLVFLVSGLMHEYLVVTCRGGFGPYTGYTVGFFLLQGLGVLAVGRTRRPRLPRAAAIALQLVFMLATTPLFFVPLDDALGYSRWWKREGQPAMSPRCGTVSAGCSRNPQPRSTPLAASKPEV
jgi:D-alanyl-lipoteichoic acid acyltransferase DltB (MBOAT superfamily)